MNLDILKLIIVFIAILYFSLKVRPHMKPANYRIATIGLGLLLFAAVLDFCDGIRALDNVLILGRNCPFHDILEDQFGDSPGLALFIIGVFREIINKRNRTLQK